MLLRHRLLGVAPALAACLLLAGPAQALKSDRDQPVSIDADNMEIDMETGVRTYTGNVVITQGTLVIRGDKIVVRYDDGTVKDATSFGKPATFKQRPDGKDEDVKGRAPKMYLDKVADKLFMYEDAVLIQGKDTIHGKEIHYNLATNKMTVKSGRQKASASASTPAGSAKVETSESGRARIVIQPKNRTSGAQQSQ
jgi:lipopolysaccharide export system protein LptA